MHRNFSMLTALTGHMHHPVLCIGQVIEQVLRGAAICFKERRLLSQTLDILGPELIKGSQYVNSQRGRRQPKLDVNPKHNVLTFLALT